MSNNLNAVQLHGRLTRDPETRTTTNGTEIASFSLAVNGRNDDDTLFMECIAFGKTAEVITQYLTKGRQAIVEGRLQQSNWNDKETGKKRSKIELVVGQVHFMSDGERGQQDSGSRDNAPTHEDIEDKPIDLSEIPF